MVIERIGRFRISRHKWSRHTKGNEARLQTQKNMSHHTPVSCILQGRSVVYAIGQEHFSRVHAFFGSMWIVVLLALPCLLSACGTLDRMASRPQPVQAILAAANDMGVFVTRSVSSAKAYCTRRCPYCFVTEGSYNQAEPDLPQRKRQGGRARRPTHSHPPTTTSAARARTRARETGGRPVGGAALRAVFRQCVFISLAGAQVPSGPAWLNINE
jgi:hypothetical protein